MKKNQTINKNNAFKATSCYILIISLLYVMINCNVNQTRDNNKEEQIDSTFVSFVSFFEKASKEKKEIEVPFKILEKINKKEYDTVHYFSEAYALNIINDNNFIGLILKIGCRAGGDCANYYLYTYNKSGKLISQEAIGLDQASIEEESYFNYELLNSNTIKVNQEYTKYDDDYISILDTVYTKTVKISTIGEVEISQ